jgi:dihydrofolate reductase
MNIAIIAAVSDNGVIGHQGRIPWHISDDLKRFKRLTLGHAVIMGRKTYQSIGKPLAGRVNVVLTRQLAIPGVTCFPNLASALSHLRELNMATAFIIGGSEVYREALPLANRLHLTIVHRHVTGDATFPEFDRSDWREVSREEHDGYTFADYTRAAA